MNEIPRGDVGSLRAERPGIGFWVLPVVFIVLDILFSRYSTWNPKQWFFYGVSWAGTLSLWFVVGWTILLVRRRWVRLSLAVGTGTVYAITLILVYGYRATVGLMPNYYTFEFLLDEPLNSWILVRDSFTWLHGLILLSAIALLSRALYRGRPRTSGKRILGVRPGWIALPPILLFVVVQLVLHNNVRFTDQCFTADMTLSTITLRNVSQRLLGKVVGNSGLLARAPMQIPDIQHPGLRGADGRPVNILILLTESLRADALDIYGNTRQATPFIDSLVGAIPDRVVRFDHALSNASATLISLPSILTGVAPVQEARLTHSLPLFWEYAKAAGYDETFFMTSQSHDFYNFRIYFNVPAIDHMFNKEISGDEFANDLGIDDRRLVDHFEQWLDARDNSSSFAGVLQFNATHYPYWTPDAAKRFPEETSHDKYDNATYFLDLLIAKVIRDLDARGLLDHTLILLTSDHGEAFMEHGIAGHRDAYYYEFLHIPFFWIIPDEVIADSAWHDKLGNLRRNASRNVSNIDLIPTMTDFMGFWDDPAFASIRSGFIGQSLMDPADSMRPIIACNNNAISRYQTGLSMVIGDGHYILNLGMRKKDKEEFYWHTDDPGEKINVIADVSPKLKGAVYREFARYPLCVGLFSRRGIDIRQYASKTAASGSP